MSRPPVNDGDIGTTGAAEARQAWQRLASSREDIGRWLAGHPIPPPVPPGDPGAAGPQRAPSSSLLTVLSGLLLRRWLGASAAGGAEQWADPGPHLGVALAQASLAPLAQRHPWALVAGAAALGATVVVAWPAWRVVRRPLFHAWRWSPWVAPLMVPLLSPYLAAAAARCLQPSSSASPAPPSSAPSPASPSVAPSPAARSSDRPAAPPP